MDTKISFSVCFHYVKYLHYTLFYTIILTNFFSWNLEEKLCMCVADGIVREVAQVLLKVQIS